ncbi:DUF599 family protein [Hydromonas duriensis]|uniref:Uncharacterized protein DUF599 n=1 Tax=Hydromonas duriensis TaxID=1527608 RepID=A0A4R6Y624_9BURK|nr:DUF599 family protein [Hydromonas duriensis]TDR30182.1 uncharacterized protein DUF599 [Hydromonas duriensis]
MNREHIENWIRHLIEQGSGDITAVQTLRNAIMAASVLASAALVALMGVLATAPLHQPIAVAVAAGLLVLSSFFSIRTIWLLAALSFQVQQLDKTPSEKAQRIMDALNAIKYAAIFLTLALSVAACGALLGNHM